MMEYLIQGQRDKDASWDMWQSGSHINIMIFPEITVAIIEELWVKKKQKDHQHSHFLWYLVQDRLSVAFLNFSDFYQPGTFL